MSSHYEIVFPDELAGYLRKHQEKAVPQDAAEQPPCLVRTLGFLSHYDAVANLAFISYNNVDVCVDLSLLESFDIAASPSAEPLLCFFGTLQSGTQQAQDELIVARIFVNLDLEQDFDVRLYERMVKMRRQLLQSA